MDGNNQYGQAMTKPLPYSCIKKQKHVPSLSQLSKLLESLDENYPIGHLFTVDIKFNDVNEKTLLFNEIDFPIFEKKQNN